MPLCLLLAVLSAAPVPAVVEPAPTVPRHELRLSPTFQQLTGAFFPAASGLSLELLYQYLFKRFEVGGGLRSTFQPLPSTVPLELFARGGARLRMGRWEPSLGVEVGWSGWVLGRQGLYASLHLAPARFRFAWFVFSGPAVSFGTTVVRPGEVLRLELSVVSAGVAL